MPLEASHAAEVPEITLRPNVMPLFRRQYDNNIFTGETMMWVVQAVLGGSRHVFQSSEYMFLVSKHDHIFLILLIWWHTATAPLCFSKKPCGHCFKSNQNYFKFADFALKSDFEKLFFFFFPIVFFLSLLLPSLLPRRSPINLISGFFECPVSLYYNISDSIDQSCLNRF